MMASYRDNEKFWLFYNFNISVLNTGINKAFTVFVTFWRSIGPCIFPYEFPSCRLWDGGVPPNRQIPGCITDVFCQKKIQGLDEQSKRVACNPAAETPLLSNR
jgi:hypothetical protein